MAATYSLLSKALRQSSTNLSSVDWQPMPLLKGRKGLQKFSKLALRWRFMDFFKKFGHERDDTNRSVVVFVKGIVFLVYWNNLS